ncbi:MAG: mevalonate kinase [Candidatus Binatia bacterium]
MVKLFVPGRLCLFGEHSDWAGSLRAVDPEIAPGACIVTGTDQGIAATAVAAAGFELTAALPDGRVYGPLRLPMDGPALQRAAGAADFFSYAAGVVAEVYRRYRPPGLRITTTDSGLPVRRGLSSSAAICVLIARAFNLVHGLGLSVREEMDLAYRGEIASGSQCGRMDQACAYGKRPVLLHFDGDEFEVELLRPRRALLLLIVDLMHEKDTRRILADLRAHFLGPESDGRTALREALGRRNTQLIAAARAALESGDAPSLGALMTEAQAVFDRSVAPACPSELGAPRLHAVLRHAAVPGLTWGGKGVGSQGDGAAQFVCRGREERDELARRLTAEGLQCLPLTIQPLAAQDSALRTQD